LTPSRFRISATAATAFMAFSFDGGGRGEDAGHATMSAVLASSPIHGGMETKYT
jgi:hypothetical protein